MLRLISTRAAAAFLLIAALISTGCTGSKGTEPTPESVPTEDSTTKSLRAGDIVGKWRLVRAGGQSPGEIHIRLQEIDIAADGTWTSKIVVKRPGAYPDVFGNQGTWSLADGRMSLKFQPTGLVVVGSKPVPDSSQVRLEAGRLVIAPDCFMQISKQGTPPLAGEYERRSPAAPRVGKDQDPIAAMRFVKVPRGTFWMGWDSKGQQSKQVEIKQDFELAAYTVTQEEWQALMGSNPSFFSAAALKIVNGAIQGGGSGMVNYHDEADLRRFPVEQVSWNDVQEFLKKLNERENGKGWLYRLPTEAEWEYACRGAATAREECSFDFYLDKPTNDLSSKQANCNGQFPAGKGEKREEWNEGSKKVGSFAPNKLGLYDMHGNVEQWCADLFDAKGSERAVRGGNWGSAAEGCRAARRNSRPPSLRLNYCGFRVARLAVGGK